MRSKTITISLLLIASGCAIAQGKKLAPPRWIQKRSNQNAQVLLSALARYDPESASLRGESVYDKEVIDLKPGFNERSNSDLQKAIDELRMRLVSEKDSAVAQDLNIMIDAAERNLSKSELVQRTMLPYFDMPQIVFGGIQSLLDEQVGPERRNAAIVRLRRYAGMEPGYQPITKLAENYTRERLKEPQLIGPYKGEVENNLAQALFFIKGINELFAKYEIAGYEPAYAKLKEQLIAYNDFVKGEVLPRTRADFRLPPALYALQLRDFGIDIPPEQLSSMAHAAFNDIQKQMQELAPQVASENGISATDYREVMSFLKRKQISGKAILPFYEARIRQIEARIQQHHIVTLPHRSMRFHLASEAESAAVPAPNMKAPPLLNNTGQRGEFVLPLSVPAAPGQPGAQKLDDFTYDAVAWTLTAHEGRPGHELQFDSMVENGVSTARAVFAFNSTNAEGWGLYSEWLMEPYEPKEGQLVTLQFRLFRAAHAFLDSEVQSGKTTPEEARRILTHDVVLSDAWANQVVQRYMFWAPGQANSYFYGFTRLLAPRKETENALGRHFNQTRFHDFILSQGLLPPDLMRKAVFEQFIPRMRLASASP